MSRSFLSAIFLSACIYFAWVQAAQARSCPEALRYLDAAREAYKERDVEYEIAQFRKAVGACKMPLVDFKVSAVTLASWEKKGYEVSLTQWRDIAKAKSRYKGVAFEGGQIRLYAEKLDRFNPKLKEELEALGAKGDLNEKKERQACHGPVDLRGSKLGPVHQQGEMSWCYAFSASDLLSFHLGKPISAADLAITARGNLGTDLMKAFGYKTDPLEQGGLARRTLKRAIQRGICLEEKFSSKQEKFKEWEHAVAQVNKLKESAANLASGQDSCSDCASSSLDKVFPVLSLSAILSILEKSVDEAPMDAVADAACNPRIDATGLAVKSKFSLPTFNESLFELMNKQLDSGNIVSVSYDARVLTDRAFGGFPSPSHTSTVVGRRFNNGTKECEYLVRNSYGSGCGSYDSTYSCEAGNIWVPKPSLSRALFDVVYISK